MDRYQRHASSSRPSEAAAMMDQGLLWQKTPPFSLYPADRGHLARSSRKRVYGGLGYHP
jgi:hypothetical protein